MNWPLFLLKSLGWVLASWILVHILSVFGWFVVIGYVTWCCLLSRKSLGWQRIAGHSLLIILVSLLSAVLVFGEAKALEYFGVSLTKKTVEFVIPSEGQYRLGEIFPMKIEVVGVTKPINAVQVDIGFNPDQLEVVNISTSDSFANIFIQKEINNEGGYARLTGGLPSPGWFSERGTFGTVLFKGKAPGLTQVKFLPTTLVLANDGKGTNVIKELASSSYLILPDKITRQEEERQKKLLANGKKVLGESTQIQLEYYEPDSVLGLWTARELNQGQVLGEAVPETNDGLLWLAELDQWILSVWEKALKVIER